VKVREVLDAAVVRQWCRLAADALGRTREEIDALNVFPVPDADTGTNLHITVLAAAEATAGLPDDAGAGATWAALAQGALLGARGNSGIIVSQMFRGLAEVLGEREEPPGGTAFRAALAHAAVLARAAVARPVEGTILSVLDAASAGPAGRTAALAEVARGAAERARAALERTPRQLEVLAGNGVVDAGGAGMCVVLDALAAVITEEYPDRYLVPGKIGGAEPPAPAPAGGRYEVMYLIDAADETVPELRAALDGLGDSLVVVGGDGLWNVHVHADDAGAAIEAGIAAGRPHRIRVTYLPEDRLAAPAGRPGRAGVADRGDRAGRGVVAVTAGSGLAALFEDAGARVVIREPGGGPPPIAVLLDRVLEAGREIVILPNDLDVIALAEAAAALAREHGVRVAVVPTEASVQGLSALAVHDSGRRFDDDVIGMTHAAAATRHARLEVTAAEVLGRIAGEVCVRGTDLAEVARQIVDRMLSGGGELVTLVPGADGVAQDLCAMLEERLRFAHPDAVVVRYDGGQDRFPLLVGVE
jgi:DAK2 domain fusion protein YloV